MTTIGIDVDETYEGTTLLMEINKMSLKNFLTDWNTFLHMIDGKYWKIILSL